MKDMHLTSVGFLITPMLFSRTFIAFYPLISYFDFRLLLASAAGVVWAMLAIFSSVQGRRLWALYGLSACLLIVGFFMQMAVIEGLVVAGMLSVLINLSTICLGAGYAIYCCLWMRAFETKAPATSLVCITISLALGAVISNLPILLLAGSPAGAMICFFIRLAALILSFICLLQELRRKQIIDSRECVSAEKGEILRYARRPFLASVVSALAIGLLVINVSDYSAYGGWIVIVSLLAFAVLVFFLTRRNSTMPGYMDIFFSSALMFATVLLLASAAISGSSNGFLWMLSFVSAPIYDIVIFSSLAAVAYLFNVASWRWICIGYFLNEAAYLAGSGLESVTRDDMGNIICVIVLICYLLFLIVTTALELLRSSRNNESPVKEQITDTMAEEFGLTRREKDILFHLLQGRSYESVGKKLFIAPSTVKTHVSHIYAKVGVKTRDELIDLFDPESKSGERAGLR